MIACLRWTPDGVHHGICRELDSEEHGGSRGARSQVQRACADDES